MVDLEQTLYGVIKEGDHGNHIFGPPIHGVGIEFEESPLPPGHAFFHGEFGWKIRLSSVRKVLKF